MAYASSKVTGFAELDRKFAQLERLPQRREVVVGLRAGAAILRDEERRLVPVGEGNLRRGIVTSLRPANLPSDGLTIYIGPLSAFWYANFLEFGTSNAPPHAFVRPAVDTRGSVALEVLTEHLLAAVRGAIA